MHNNLIIHNKLVKDEVIHQHDSIDMKQKVTFHDIQN